MRSAEEHAQLISKMNELIKDSLQTEDADGSDDLYSPVNEGEEFDESVLLEELEKLEKSLDESLFEADRKEQEVLAASPSNHAKLEEEDIAEDLEYLRQWANSL
ncbi:charged multivesicular body protein 4b [Oryzias melastigma]|uniref:charged multivesicular body protein 4b n=1 Tax=Oryzias melastigma TaxID=30732 RepID=UPI000CF7F09A|nr:charged multivesicular body protein 4b [Oryzias melastigma]